jgi:formylglycine-generating enzyme required for sulfatase activity/uncharacterized caspase-like protein
MTNIAITIGVQEYEFLSPLKYTANDAKKMREFLLEEGNFDEVFYFSDDSPKINGFSTRPTRSRLELLLEDEVKTLYLKTGDNLWFFFAGHGSRENNIDYLIPIDGYSNAEKSGISVNYIIQQLQNSGADNIVLILDACRDKGDGARGGEGVGKQTEKEAREKGIITIFSCSPNELSWELEELEQGVFTYALLEGLGSKGKRATVEKLNEYLRHRVQELSQKKGKRQTPRIIADPIEKSHLILMPKYATLSDISFLKNYAARAERKQEWQKAKSLWRRVLNASQGADEDAIEALTNIGVEERLGRINENLSVVESDVAEVKSSNLREKVSLKELDKGELFTFEVVKVNNSGSIVNRSQGSARQKIEDLGNGVSLEMVKIPGGRFQMGSPDTEAERMDREGPQHYVDVPEFFMGKYVVTQGQWKAIASRTDLKVQLDLKTEPSYFKEPYKDIDRWNRPVEQVSWFEAVEFCKRLSKLTGRNYRLPSEAEWEYACRAGTTTPFHFGETINTELANYRGTDNKERNWSGSYGDGPKGEYREQTTPVGQFPANAFGLYDMHGNVWEWCADEWHDNYAGAPTDGSIWLNGNKDKSPLRGGSWDDLPTYCRSAFRIYFNRRDDHYYIIGFRLVCDGGRTL